MRESVSEKWRVEFLNHLGYVYVNKNIENGMKRWNRKIIFI
jgi:hypothetical protein